MERIGEIIRKAVRTAFVLPILLYRKLISPALPDSCIYEPSCSQYAIEAIMKHGLLKGVTLGLARLFRCVGAFYTGGLDEVPEVFTFKAVSDGYHRFIRKKHKS